MTTPILSIQDLNITFKQGTQLIPAVKNAYLDIMAGEFLGLVGESGSGKSITAMSILGLLPSNNHVTTSGKIIFDQKNLLQASQKTLQKIRGNSISMIFQEPMTSLNPLHTIGRQIGEILEIHQGLRNHELKLRVIELLERVEISNAKERLSAYPHELSGGQRQRVMIAMALANNPQLLIADEPTTALDVTIEKKILRLLKNLQQQLNLAVLFITHDLNIVRHYADRVSVMHQGKIIETQSTKMIFSTPKEEYTKLLLAASPEGNPKPITPQANQLIHVENLKVWFPIKKGIFKRTVDHVKALNHINFNLHQGETLGIVGESGSGKSTLAKAILRLIQSEGKIFFEKTDLNLLQQKALRPLRRELQIVFQDPYGSLNPSLSIQQILEEGMRIHHIGNSQEERLKLIFQTLHEVNLATDIIHRYPHEFSGGQRQRIAIARVLLLKPQLIILDEPTSALDRRTQCDIIALLQNLQNQHQISFIFISHDLAIIRALSHQILVLKDGDIVEHGSRDELFSNPKHPYTQELMEAAFS